MIVSSVQCTIFSFLFCFIWGFFQGFGGSKTNRRASHSPRFVSSILLLSCNFSLIHPVILVIFGGSNGHFCNHYFGNGQHFSRTPNVDPEYM